MVIKMKREYFIIYVSVFFLSAVIIPILLFEVLESIQIKRMMVSTFFQVIIFGGISYLLIRKHQIPLLKIKNKAKPLMGFIRIVFVSLVTFSLLRITRDSLHWIYVGFTGDSSIFIFPSAMNGGQFVIMVLFLGLVPSIFEELFFRVISSHLLKEVKPERKILLTALVFSLFHINAGLESLLISFFLGIILMKCYDKRKNYIEVVGIHLFYNILVILFNNILLFPTDAFLINFWAGSPIEALFIGSLLLTIPSIIFSTYLFKSNPKQKE